MVRRRDMAKRGAVQPPVFGYDNRGLHVSTLGKSHMQVPKPFAQEAELVVPAAFWDVDLESASFSNSRMSFKGWEKEFNASPLLQWSCANQRGRAGASGAEKHAERAPASVVFCGSAKSSGASLRRHSSTHGSEPFSGSLKRMFSKDCKAERSGIKDIAVSRLMLLTRLRAQENQEREEAAARAEERAAAETDIPEGGTTPAFPDNWEQCEWHHRRPVRRNVRGKTRSRLKLYFGSPIDISSVPRPRLLGGSA
ncbi:hypothetical protein FVE85_0082 [Porphyridium purpureum]|uniref:Uncharacterized protein n=1 Tax=Porphyridium purpureum TaxID=35688 RepID=A0A5J4Z0J5_PORPP|nr:hypothetical protein FVE85_0082 [Porphyridium purpureum]|eukprot:POR1744..scf208_2